MAPSDISPMTQQCTAPRWGTPQQGPPEALAGQSTRSLRPVASASKLEQPTIASVWLVINSDQPSVSIINDHRIIDILA